MGMRGCLTAAADGGCWVGGRWRVFLSWVRSCGWWCPDTGLNIALGCGWLPIADSEPIAACLNIWWMGFTGGLICECRGWLEWWSSGQQQQLDVSGSDWWARLAVVGVGRVYLTYCYNHPFFFPFSITFGNSNVHICKNVSIVYLKLTEQFSLISKMFEIQIYSSIFYKKVHMNLLSYFVTSFKTSISYYLDLFFLTKFCLCCWNCVLPFPNCKNSKIWENWEKSLYVVAGCLGMVANGGSSVVWFASSVVGRSVGGAVVINLGMKLERESDRRRRQ